MNGRKHNIPMCAALVLLLLTMITTHLTSGLYARYTTTASSHDSARVAKFKVSCVVDTVTNNGTENEFKVTVTNQSDVAVTYTLEVVPDPENGIPLDVIIDNAELTADQQWKLSIDGEGAVNTHTMKLAPHDVTDITKTADGSEVTKEVKFTVNVKAVQID